MSDRSFGLVKQAAVLVALFEKPGDDQLSVLLTTRAKTLRQELLSSSTLIA
jgi:coenzyme A diphosphatase NUDT7